MTIKGARFCVCLHWQNLCRQHNGDRASGTCGRSFSVLVYTKNFYQLVRLFLEATSLGCLRNRRICHTISPLPNKVNAWVCGKIATSRQLLAQFHSQLRLRFTASHRMVTRKSQGAAFTAEARKTSKYVESMLAQATSMAHLKFDENACLILKTDATQIAVGAKLKQVHGTVTEPLHYLYSTRIHYSTFAKSYWQSSWEWNTFDTFISVKLLWFSLTM